MVRRQKSSTAAPVAAGPPAPAAAEGRKVVLRASSVASSSGRSADCHGGTQQKGRGHGVQMARFGVGGAEMWQHI